MCQLWKFQERRAQQLYEQGKFDAMSCADLLKGLQISEGMKTKVRGEGVQSMILGAYVHGGLRGTSKEARRRPWLTRYLNMVMQQKAAEDLNEPGHWTSIGIFRAKDVPPHRDMRNQQQSMNYVMKVQGEDQAGLWVERDADAPESTPPVDQLLPDGTVLKGDITSLQDKMVMFDPRRRHAYVADSGEQWLLAGFTPLGVDKLPVDTKAYLSLCGFPLEGTGAEWCVEDEEDGQLYQAFMEESDLEEEIDEEVVETKARRMRCLLQQEHEIVEENGGFARWDAQLQEELEWCQECLASKTARAMKISPTEAQDFEVEKLLESLQGPLEVVHNVSLPEVKRYIGRWKDSIIKEVKALVDSGTVRRLSPEQVRELKKSGLVVLPGKAVFTAKPPTDTSSGSHFSTKVSYSRMRQLSGRPADQCVCQRHLSRLLEDSSGYSGSQGLDGGVHGRVECIYPCAYAKRSPIWTDGTYGGCHGGWGWKRRSVADREGSVWTPRGAKALGAIPK